LNNLTMNEILALSDYDRVRDLLHPLIMLEKSRRRVAVGSHITLLFENRQTAWYQVQEMVSTEKITAPAAIQHEIDTYNELVPQGAELVATMLIEYSEVRERDAALRRLVGLERHLSIVVGERRYAAKFDDRQMSEERVSSVQFVRFPVASISAEEFRALAQTGKVAIEVDHPNLAAQAHIAGAVAEALSEDLE
jgi:hypothetical protein